MMINPADAYTTSQVATMSDRETEAFCLMRSALLLSDVQKSMENRALLEEVLEKNKILWVALTSKINDDDHPLPKDIKQNMANLALFIFKRTIDILVEPKAEKLDAIININRNIAAGLRAKPEEAEQPQE